MDREAPGDGFWDLLNTSRAICNLYDRSILFVFSRSKHERALRREAPSGFFEDGNSPAGTKPSRRELFFVPQTGPSQSRPSWVGGPSLVRRRTAKSRGNRTSVFYRGGPCPWSLHILPQRTFVARRAPSAIASNFAQQIDGWPTRVPRPQSVPASTFSRPTRLA